MRTGYRCTSISYFFKAVLFYKLRQLNIDYINKTKNVNDTIQAGTPQQLTPITAGPEHIKLK